MRFTPGCRMALVMVGAIALTRVAFAQPEGVPAEIDAARASERYAIGPGTEPVVSDMLGRGEPLPGGCAFASGRIERTYVLAAYTCGADQVELRFLHPEVAPPGSVRTKAFAIAVTAGTPPGGLVEAIADRVRAREKTFEWTTVGGRDPYGRQWNVAAVAVAVGLVVALGLVVARRKRSRTASGG
jgi:hypothetical protein